MRESGYAQGSRLCGEVALAIRVIPYLFQKSSFIKNYKITSAWLRENERGCMQIATKSKFIETPFSLIIGFGSSKPDIYRDREALGFVLFLGGRGWSAQHHAWDYGNKWPDSYVRHSRVSCNLSAGWTFRGTFNYLIRDRATKQEGWRLYISYDLDKGCIEIGSSDKASLTEIKSLIDDWRKDSSFIFDSEEKRRFRDLCKLMTITAK